MTQQPYPTIEGKSPWEFACSWYTADEVQRCIASADYQSLGNLAKIPTDINSRKFAEWMTEQYRLAMRKGIELGLTASDAKNTASQPRWAMRPSGPGMWVCLPETGSAFPKPVVIDLTQSDIDRGAPFRSSCVFGPIPPTDLSSDGRDAR